MATTAQDEAVSLNGAGEPVARVVARFEPISLGELGTAALMSRFDTKYAFAATLLPDMLERCAATYQVLEVSSRRFFHYRTQYFDTGDLRFYHAHHRGRANRHKVRVRSYVDSAESFLEVKTKSNKDRTTKIRIRLPDGAAPLEPLQREPFSHLGRLVAAASLREVVTVDYTRVTLVRSTAAERVTIDTMLTFSGAERATAYPALAIAEVKQHERGRSPFRELMRELRIRSASLSKYCLGVMSLVPDVKRNRFKFVFNRVERIGVPEMLRSGNGNDDE